MLRYGWLATRKFKPIQLCCQCRQIHNGTLIKEYTIDQHGGITIDLERLPKDTTLDQFHSLLSNSLSHWRNLDSIHCVWLKVPIMHSKFIAVAAETGFSYHHAEHDTALLTLWIRKDSHCSVPRFASHQVGVAGLVIDEKTNNILVVKDKRSKFNLWKFPGGLSELGEDIGDTAVREVFEETGIKTEFASVLGFRQQHKQPGAWGRSDIFVVCRMRPLSYKINFCNKEIKACEWINIFDLKKEVQASSITDRLLTLAVHGLEKSFSDIDIQSEEMNSLYRGLKYKLYHRPL